MTTAGYAACLLVGLALAIDNFNIFNVYVPVLDRATLDETFRSLASFTRLFLLAGAVAFLVWQYRVVKKLHDFGRGGLTWSPTRSVLFWFVPFLNLVHGYRVISEAWRASDPEDVKERGRSWTMNTVPPLVLSWWLAYLMSRVTSTIYRSSLTTAMLVIATTLETAAAVLMFLVIRSIDARQADFQRALNELARKRERRAERKEARKLLETETETADVA